MTYYLDSVRGSDGNCGTSPGVPWKTLEKLNSTVFAPGDEILLSANCVFCGQLHPKGDGTAEAPIRIGRYGGGKKPCIDGGGSHGTREGNYVDGAAVLLYNQNYWEISDLEITNCNPYFKQGFEYYTPDGEYNVMIPSPQNRYRYGVLVRWDNYGTGHHVHIKNCDIHDVNAELGRFVGEGILVVSTGTIGGVQTNFDGILIENNRIADIDRTGISVWSAWAEGRGIDYHGDPTREDVKNFYHTTIGPWKGSTNVVIRGNSIFRTAGDAILVNTVIGAVIEHNYVEHCCHEVRAGPNAAVWPHNSDGTVMQYNEVCYTHGVMDGQAFDIDLSCSDTVVRYNYTHHNEGGFLLVMGGVKNSEVYGNISENDRNGIFWGGDGDINTHIRDNVFYLGMEGVKVFRSPYDRSDWEFTNNTFYARVPGTEVHWKTKARYRGNNYWNIANLPDDPEPKSVKPDFEPKK